MNPFTQRFRSGLSQIFVPFLLALTLTGAAGALEITVKVESLAPDNGGVQTPVWVGFHNGSFDLYDIGTAATPGLERIAEDGNFGDLSVEFLDSGFGTVDGAVFGPNAPPVFPGETATATFTVDPNDASSRYFSYASMVIPSNDAFVANGNPRAHPIFDGNGNFLGGSFIVEGTQVRDAGTEVNDEVPANTAFFGQAAPDTGVVEGGTVQVHGGLLPVGSGGILDAPDFANADFTRPGYQVLRITVTAERTTNLRFPIAGSQQVPSVETDNSGVCSIALATSGANTLDIECVHDLPDAVAAHIHLGDAGENGDVAFDLGDATSPINGTFELTDDQVDTLLDGGFYVNVHTTTFAPGELRGQIDGCFNGPAALCLDDRFQVTATYNDFDGGSGNAVAADLSADSGTFYFFNADNVELLIKTIDGCDFNNRYWVFASGLTNLGVDITVEDTQNGTLYEISNPLDRDFVPVLDNDAFATCP